MGGIYILIDILKRTTTNASSTLYNTWEIVFQHWKTKARADGLAIAHSYVNAVLVMRNI